MEKKVLFVATTAKGHMNVFHIPYIQMFKEKGWQVDSITNGDEKVPYVDHDYAVSIERQPFRMRNGKAIWQVCSIMRQRKYDLVICHTPMGGAVARVAARICKLSPVIYMAHGFHFYKGAPMKNHILYKSMERLLAHWTDGLIVINQEDYEAAKRFRLRKNGKVFLLNGIGVPIDKICSTDMDRRKKRKELGVAEDAFVVVHIGEMIVRKNQKTAIAAISQCKIRNCVLLLCGRGEKEEELKALVKKEHLEQRVIFCGFRRDVNEILKAADVFLFPSFQEGLPVSVMEAMAAGLPVICSDIRGNRDLIDEKGGFLFAPEDAVGMSSAIEELKQNATLRERMGQYNAKKIEKYDIQILLTDMQRVYEEVLHDRV